MRTHDIKPNTQFSNETVATRVANTFKHLLPDVRIGSMTLEQLSASFEKMQVSMGGTSYRQLIRDIESQVSIWHRALTNIPQKTRILNNLSRQQKFKISKLCNWPATTTDFKGVGMVRHPGSNPYIQWLDPHVHQHINSAALTYTSRFWCLRFWNQGWYDQFAQYSRVFSRSDQVFGSWAQKWRSIYIHSME